MKKLFVLLVLFWVGYGQSSGLNKSVVLNESSLESNLALVNSFYLVSLGTVYLSEYEELSYNALLEMNHSWGLVKMEYQAEYFINEAPLVQLENTMISYSKGVGDLDVPFLTAFRPGLGLEILRACSYERCKEQFIYEAALLLELNPFVHVLGVKKWGATEGFRSGFDLGFEKARFAVEWLAKEQKGSWQGRWLYRQTWEMELWGVESFNLESEFLSAPFVWAVSGEVINWGVLLKPHVVHENYLGYIYSLRLGIYF
jgi:hypothetical protein